MISQVFKGAVSCRLSQYIGIAMLFDFPVSDFRFFRIWLLWYNLRICSLGQFV